MAAENNFVRTDPMEVARSTAIFCSAIGGTDISSFSSNSSRSLLRFVVPLLERLQASTNADEFTMRARNSGRIMSESTRNTGKSFVTRAPSNSGGTIPNAPLRPSMRLMIRCPDFARNCGRVLISLPRSTPRSITPFPYSLTVICLYSRSAATSASFFAFCRKDDNGTRFPV